MVAPGGHAWLLQGVCMVSLRGACLVAPGGACMVAPGGGMRGFFNEIWSMSGRFASYWNAFLFCIFLSFVVSEWDPVYIGV